MEVQFCPALVRSLLATHVFPDKLRDGAGQHEAGDSAAQDVEERVHDPRAGGGAHRRAEGTAERTGGRPTATAYLRGRRQQRREVKTYGGPTVSKTERRSSSILLTELHWYV